MMKAIENGTPIKDVAKKWGVFRTTIYRYLEKNKSQVIKNPSYSSHKELPQPSPFEVKHPLVE